MCQANKFDKDSVHKMGFNKLFKDYSDKMWENGKDLLKYIIKRGGRVGPTAQGVNFINVLRAAFILIGPESVKKDWKLDYLFTLLGSACVKAVRRTLMKLSPSENCVTVTFSLMSHIIWRHIFTICISSLLLRAQKHTIKYIILILEHGEMFGGIS